MEKKIKKINGKFNNYYNYFIRKGIFLTLILIFLILFFSFISAFSNLEINSTNYSGRITEGSSSGNLTASTIEGSTASFWQHAAGFLNNSLFSGIHGFTFNVSLPTGLSPTISIVSPENKTYLKNSIYLNYTSSNANYVWYNINGGANPNTTITGNTTFATSSGLQTLYLWANNSYGTVNDEITFTRNSTKFIIIYNNYSGSKKGDSNDFNSSTYEDIQNLSNIILENTDYGKIKFNEAINLTNDRNYTDNILDLDINTEISNTSIILNSTALPNFNKSATLYLYNLGLDDPRILRDGTECPSTICTEVNYSGGTLVFNVTSFTNYSADETPEEAAPITPTGGTTGGSSGGGGGTSAVTTFNIDTNKISVSLNPGKVKTESIILTNTGINTISINVNNLFGGFVATGESLITLNAGQSKTLPLYIMAKEETIPDLYLGKIILSSGDTKKEILIAIEVESTGALLDLNVEINKNYKEILPGENILAQIKLFNLGGEGRRDIYIEYIIKDYDGNEIARETESLAIETQITLLKEILMPTHSKIGDYIFYVRATYEGKVASGSDVFEVVSSKVTDREKLYIVIIIILCITLSFIIYYILFRRDKKKRVVKINLSKITRR